MPRRLIAFFLVVALLASNVRDVKANGVAFYLSVALHTAIIAGLIYDHVRAQDQATTNAEKAVWIDLQTSTDYTPPTPPPPPQTLPVLKEPVYRSNTQSQYSTTSSTTSNTLAGSIEELNKQLSSSANANQPWYNKIKAVGVVKTPDSAPGKGGGTTATPGDAASGAQLFVVYRVLVDFTLNSCERYTAGASFHYMTTPSFPGPTDSGCIYNQTVNGGYGVAYNSGPAMTQSNSYYSAGSGLVPYSISYTAATCNNGYTFDANAGNCNLTNKAVVNSAPDQVCPVMWGGDAGYQVNMFDPDCALQASTGSITLSSDQKTVTIRTNDPSSPGRTHTQTASRNTDGSTNLGVKTNDPSGLQQGTDLKIKPTGEVEKQTPKQPVYAPPGGTGTPTNIAPVVVYPSPGTAPVQCGGNGMPACAVDFGPGAKPVQCGGDGMPACKVDIGLGDGGDGDAKVPEFDSENGPEGFDKSKFNCDDCTVGATNLVDWFKSFMDLKLDTPNVSCSSAFAEYAKNEDAFNGKMTVKFDPDDICQVMSKHETTIYNVFQFVFALTALFILIS